MLGFGITIATIYALLHLLVGIIQLRQQQVPIRNSIIFIIGSMIILSSFLFLNQLTILAIIIAIGFICIQTSAIFNGIHLHGKFTLKHQIVRVLILVVVLFAVIY